LPKPTSWLGLVFTVSYSKPALVSAFNLSLIPLFHYSFMMRGNDFNLAGLYGEAPRRFSTEFNQNDRQP
jgi:hypothetical protein